MATNNQSFQSSYASILIDLNKRFLSAHTKLSGTPNVADAAEHPLFNSMVLLDIQAARMQKELTTRGSDLMSITASVNGALSAMSNSRSSEIKTQHPAFAEKTADPLKKAIELQAEKDQLESDINNFVTTLPNKLGEIYKMILEEKPTQQIQEALATLNQTQKQLADRNARLQISMEKVIGSLNENYVGMRPLLGTQKVVAATPTSSPSPE